MKLKCIDKIKINEWKRNWNIKKKNTTKMDKTAQIKMKMSGKNERIKMKNRIKKKKWMNEE